MKVLPLNKSDGCIYVKGTVKDILSAIAEAKGEAK
jgi:hypothetical protein